MIDLYLLSTPGFILPDVSYATYSAYMEGSNITYTWSSRLECFPSAPDGVNDRSREPRRLGDTVGACPGGPGGPGTAAMAAIDLADFLGIFLGTSRETMAN